MFRMKHSSCDELVEFFYRLIVVVVSDRLCFLYDAMIFEVCGEFFDVFSDKSWVIASDLTFCWVNYGWEAAIE